MEFGNVRISLVFNKCLHLAVVKINETTGEQSPIIQFHYRIKRHVASIIPYNGVAF